MTYTRKLTPTERYYVSCDTHAEPYHTPCVNQMVLEGSGEFNEDAWRHAVATASMKNPGSRLVLQGKLGFSRWVAGDNPARLRVLEDNTWDGLADAHCPFNDFALPSRKGPTSEIVLIKSDPLRLVIRTHHGTMDGRGTQAFVEDIFRVLNGLQPLGENSRLTDLELLRSIHGGDKFGQFYQDDAIPPTGMPDGSLLGSTWLRRRLRGQPRQVLAKVAIAIAQLCARLGEKSVRIQLPVDMRPHAKGIRSTANLTGAIIMELAPDTSLNEWEKNIRHQLSEKREAELPRFATTVPLTWINWIPLSVMSHFNQKLVDKRLVTGKYRTHAIISNLGRLPLQHYTGGGFEATNGFFIPPQFDASAFFLTMAGSPSGIDFVLRVPQVLATNSRMQEAIDHIIAALSEDKSIAA